MFPREAWLLWIVGVPLWQKSFTYVHSLWMCVCVLVGVNGSVKNYKYVRRMYVYVCKRVRENIYCSNSSKVRLILFV